MKVSTILFDFDGTLADTLPVCFHSIRHVFKRYDGRRLNDDEIVAMFGPTEPDIIRLNLLNREAVDEAVEAFFACYDENHGELVKSDTRIVEMLQELKQKGYKIGVYTGKAKKSLELSLKHLGMEGMLDVEISGDDVEHAKPHPEGVLKAIRLLGADPDETLYVGDSNADIQAGKEAGVRVGGVHWFEVVQTRHFAVEPDVLFTSPGQLLEYVGAQNPGKR